MIALLLTVAAAYLVIAGVIYGASLLDEDLTEAARLLRAISWPLTLLAALVVRPWRRERPEDS